MKFINEHKVILVMYKKSREIGVGNVSMTLTQLEHECWNRKYPVTHPALIRAVNLLSTEGIVKSEKIKRNRVITLLEKGKIIGKELEFIERKLEQIKNITKPERDNE